MPSKVEVEDDRPSREVLHRHFGGAASGSDDIRVLLQAMQMRTLGKKVACVRIKDNFSICYAKNTAKYQSPWRPWLQQPAPS